jgi:hypothetical protein
VPRERRRPLQHAGLVRPGHGQRAASADPAAGSDGVVSAIPFNADGDGEQPFFNSEGFPR